MTLRNRIAIVDCRMGNLFSVHQACHTVGLDAVITDDPAVVEGADGVILPGVGAFGDAMDVLNARGIADALRRVAHSGKPLIGICLGMQLLMDESEEFGRHGGLGLIAGTVKRLPSMNGEQRVKVPQVGWNEITPAIVDAWKGTALQDIAPGTHVYFVHSYYTAPADSGVALSMTTYGGLTYCSALRRGNIQAFQFHPEKSGERGLFIYRNIAQMVAASAAVGPNL